MCPISFLVYACLPPVAVFTLKMICFAIDSPILTALWPKFSFIKDHCGSHSGKSSTRVMNAISKTIDIGESVCSVKEQDQIGNRAAEYSVASTV